MLDATLLPSFLVAVLMFLISPGPTTALLCSTGVSQGFSAALFTGLGISAALLVSSLATVFGLSTLLLQIPNALLALKLLGSVYFFYLAWKEWYLVTKRPTLVSSSVTLPTYFYRGFLIDVLNPGGLLFLISFLPQFVNASFGSIKMQLFSLAVIYTLCDLGFNFVLAYLSSQTIRRQTWSHFSSPDTLVLRQYALVGIYLALALYFALQSL
jgi:threonine/homoserine/homoserine lactone efflux protein